ncbi:MAG TPA: TraR/DksA C4-type zinc finger protein [Sumerlaeia bacterium]|nr:TraR/DksA C4-type zinc finger protein [Sumerlaeia bacterium]
MLPRRTPYSEREIQTLHQILLDERTRLFEILRDLESLTFRNSEDEGKSVAPGYSIHLAENATDNIDTETALLLRRDEEEALAQVMAAIERLEQGIYGVCMACGSKIGMARLRAKPDAHLCMQCRVRYDKEARRR